jgi:hypothetical protein
MLVKAKADKVHVLVVQKWVEISTGGSTEGEDPTHFTWELPMSSSSPSSNPPQLGDTGGNLEEAPPREKRKEATSGPPSPSQPPGGGYPGSTKKHKALEHLDWWQNTLDAAHRFLTFDLADTALKTLLETPTTGSTVLLPLPPVGGLTSRFINNEKNGKIPCIQRDAFTSLKMFVEGKKGLTYVHGPQGVGKSFALYHLYCTLSIDPKNRVMYISNCADLNKTAYHVLYEALTAAFALDEPFLQHTRRYTLKLDEIDWKELITYLANYCTASGLTFYAIFDQHNGLDLDLHRYAPTNLTHWPRLLPGAKIIISASANNEDTPIKMEDDSSPYWFSGGYSPAELNAWQAYFHFFDGQDLSNVTDTTANVPFELDKLRRRHTDKPALDLPQLVNAFRQSRMLELNLAHRKYRDQFLQKQEDADIERRCIFYAVNQLPWNPSEECRFDRQLFFLTEEATGAIYIKPTTPLVREMAILRLVKEDIEYMASNVLGSLFFTNDAKGRTVENYLLHEITKRCSLNVRLHDVGTDSKGEILEVEELEVVRFAGYGVPPTKPIGNTMFIPLLSNYPDIDFFIWNHDTQTLYAFQVTVGKDPTDHSNNWVAGKGLCQSWETFISWKHSHKVWITAKSLGKSVSKTKFGKECSAHKFMDIHHKDVTKTFTALKHFKWTE